MTVFQNEHTTIKKETECYTTHATCGAVMKILIGEDDQDISKIYERVLQSRGHSVTVAANGTEFVNLYRIESNRSDVSPFDLVILDQQMPLKSGTDAAKEILKENPGVQIVFISAFGGQVITNLKVNPGQVRVLAKPTTPEILIQAVEGKKDNWASRMKKRSIRV